MVKTSTFAIIAVVCAVAFGGPAVAEGKKNRKASDAITEMYLLCQQAGAESTLPTTTLTTESELTSGGEVEITVECGAVPPAS